MLPKNGYVSVIYTRYIFTRQQMIKTHSHVFQRLLVYFTLVNLLLMFSWPVKKPETVSTVPHKCK